MQQTATEFAAGCCALGEPGWGHGRAVRLSEMRAYPCPSSGRRVAWRLGGHAVMGNPGQRSAPCGAESTSANVGGNGRTLADVRNAPAARRGPNSPADSGLRLPEACLAVVNGRLRRLRGTIMQTGEAILAKSEAGIFGRVFPNGRQALSPDLACRQARSASAACGELTISTVPVTMPRAASSRMPRDVSGPMPKSSASTMRKRVASMRCLFLQAGRRSVQGRRFQRIRRRM